MKRLGSSDSLSAMTSMCPNSTDGDNQVSDNPVYKREFQAMLDGLDEEGCIDESGNKKRRLSIDQVKALEKNFEVENKLDPERKLKLALDLGLQPRQVAVWFQNRRARWKTKQLERDYGVLKANYDGLKPNYEKLQLDNEALLKEIRELKAKLSEDVKSGLSDKEGHTIVSDAAAADKKTNLETDQQTVFLDPKCEEIVAASEMEIQDFNNSGVDNILCDFKDGSSDSDSSAILNEDNNNNNSPNAAISSSSAAPHQFLSGTNINFLMSSVLVNGDIGNVQDHKDYVDYKHPFVKIEEHNFLGHVEDSCTNLFSDDQAPSLPWICSDEWT